MSDVFFRRLLYNRLVYLLFCHFSELIVQEYVVTDRQLNQP